jgi:hypothetical protein
LKIISDKDKFNLIDISFSQSQNNITLHSSEKFPVISNLTDWEIELTFLTLLSEKNLQEVSIEVNSDDCFKPGTKDILAIVTDVCAYGVRSIEILRDLPVIEIYPNPASDNLKIDLQLFQKERLEFKIFDYSGKKCFENKIFDLEKGLYSINFEISHLNDGLYLLFISNNDFIRRKLFIISK